VLLDLVFEMVELLQAMVSLLARAHEQKDATISRRGTTAERSNRAYTRLDSEYATVPIVDTNDYQVAFQSLCENDQQLIQDVLKYPLVRRLLGATFYRVAPNLMQANRSQAFLDQVENVSQDLPATFGSLQQRQAMALAQVADSWAAEYPDAQVLQLLAAVQPAEQTLALVKRLGAAAAPGAGPTVADRLDLQPPIRFTNNTERVLYAGVRQRLEQRRIQDLALDLPADSLPAGSLVASLTVGDVLARSPEAAAELLGGADRVAAVTKAFLQERQAALDAASGLAGGVPAVLVTKVESEVAAGRKPDAVLDQLQKEEEAKPEPERNPELLRNLADAKTLLELSGNRLDALAALRRRVGG
jgi:hypothetical protein